MVLCIGVSFSFLGLNLPIFIIHSHIVKSIIRTKKDNTLPYLYCTTLLHPVENDQETCYCIDDSTMAAPGPNFDTIMPSRRTEESEEETDGVGEQEEEREEEEEEEDKDDERETEVG